MTEFGKELYVIFTIIILVGLFAAMWRGADADLRKESGEQ